MVMTRYLRQQIGTKSSKKTHQHPAGFTLAGCSHSGMDSKSGCYLTRVLFEDNKTKSEKNQQPTKNRAALMLPDKRHEHLLATDDHSKKAHWTEPSLQSLFKVTSLWLTANTVQKPIFTTNHLLKAAKPSPSDRPALLCLYQNWRSFPKNHLSRYLGQMVVTLCT